MRHQAQEYVCGIFVVIPQHQKVYLVCVPITRKIIPYYDVVFYEIFSSTIEFMSQPFIEAMVMRLAVSYTPYAACFFSSE